LCASYIIVFIDFSIVSRLRYCVRTVRDYLAEIGRRGGTKSRRSLDSETARRMVARREARRAAKRAAQTAVDSSRPGGIPNDTAVSSLAIQDALLRRLTPAGKLAQVALLSRMVDQLSIQGLKQRHPTADDQTIRRLRADLRLGRVLAAAVYGELRERA
jgi:hypothetical protein